MKKLLTVILILALAMPTLALADLPDISGLTLDELIELKDRINSAIWSADNWKEVEVPPGLWQVGIDIPAGHWKIRLASDHAYAYVWYFEEPNEFGKPFATLTKYDNTAISTKDWHGHDRHEADYDMKEGWYFYCEETTIFTPYDGKPSLGFD
ncbi:MAG: hypothetical protein J6S83_11535 [Lachnospiraceae bacterium]|nr:hypothetical protein [Lachnospiraceae bacterium]